MGRGAAAGGQPREAGHSSLGRGGEGRAGSPEREEGGGRRGEERRREEEEGEKRRKGERDRRENLPRDAVHRGENAQEAETVQRARCGGKGEFDYFPFCRTF